MRSMRAASFRHREEPKVNASGLIFCVLLAVGLMLGSYTVGVGGEFSSMTTAIALDSYNIKLSGTFDQILVEYIWNLLLVLAFVIICLTSRRGEILSFAMPFVLGVQIGSDISALTKGVFNIVDTKVLVSVYLPCMLRAVAFLFLFSAVKARCENINRGVEQSVSVGVFAGLIIYFFMLALECGIFLLFLR